MHWDACNFHWAACNCAELSNVVDTVQKELKPSFHFPEIFQFVWKCGFSIMNIQTIPSNNCINFILWKYWTKGIKPQFSIINYALPTWNRSVKLKPSGLWWVSWDHGSCSKNVIAMSTLQKKKKHSARN